MIFDGNFDKETWGSEPRINKLVFIGKNLKQEELADAFTSCLDIPENQERIKAILAVKANKQMSSSVISAAHRDDLVKMKKLVAMGAVSWKARRCQRRDRGLCARLLYCTVLCCTVVLYTHITIATTTLSLSHIAVGRESGKQRRADRSPHRVALVQCEVGAIPPIYRRKPEPGKPDGVHAAAHPPASQQEVG